MNDDRMREMRLRRMAERQGLLLEKSRHLSARIQSPYSLLKGAERSRLTGGETMACSGDLDAIEKHLIGGC